MQMNEIQNMIQQFEHVIITPDGVGSKGDEAMISGCLSFLQGQKALLITTNRKLWKDALLGRTHLFDECFVSLEKIPALLETPHRLIVIGADLLDGTCGYEPAHWRLEAIQKAAKNGSQVIIFCSFRSDVEERLIQEWKDLPDNVSVFLRDSVSEENFARLIGKHTEHFSDLAFFAKPILTERVKGFCKKLQETQRKKRIIGLEISETMFRSFNTTMTDEARINFTSKIAELVARGMSADDTAFVLFSHDTRSWDNYWSDSHYASLAYKSLTEMGFSCLLQPEEYTQAELLNVLPFCNLLICGRMHMSITAYCAGVVPLIVAGFGNNFQMVDKVRGMCREWMGKEKNLILDIDQIPQFRDQVLSQTELHDILKQKQESLQSVLAIEHQAMTALIASTPVQWEAAKAQEEALAGALQRSARLSQDLAAKDILLQSKEAHIELLIQGERELQSENESLQRTTEDLQKTNEDLQDEIQSLQQTLNNTRGECQLLRDKENQLKNEVAALRNSRSYRFGNVFARILRFFIPRGSRRALCCRLLYTMVRHPITFMRKLSVRRVKKFFRLLKSGESEYAGRMMQNVIGDGAASLLPITPPDIVPVDTKEKGFEDYPVLHIPQWESPQVSIIIPVYNQFEFTYRCVESILRNTGDATYEILIANDCSTDLTTRIEEILPGVRCITNSQNLRFLRNCNNAAKHAVGRYVLFLNNDTQVQPNWLMPLITLIESAQDIGMVGSKLIYPDGKLQEAGGILWRDGSAWNYGNGQNPAQPEFNYVKQVDYISGAAIMLSRALWEEIGGFDEHFTPAYCEDSDLAFTVRKMGYRVMYQPLSVVVHFEGVSNGTDTSSGQKKYQIDNTKKFYKKWRDELERHPEIACNVFQARDYSYHKKTLLMVDHYVPQFDKDAGSRTVFQYLKLFVNAGFNVKFIGDNFYRHEPYTTALQQMGVEVLYGPYYAQNWKAWVKQHADHIDYVFLNRPHIAPTYLTFLRENTNARIVYYGHDLAFLREMREYKITGDAALKKSAEDWKPKELALMRNADMAYYPSYVEVNEVHSIDPAIKVKAIPAYLFEDINWEGYDFNNRKDIMFIGGFAHRPNVDAVKWIAEEILPELLKYLPDVKIHILGSNAPKEIQALASDHLIMEGFVTDEQLEGFYRSCRMSLVPLRYGAGIKGKVIEAMRYGAPVVTTSTGAEGIPDAEQVMLIEDDSAALAKRIAELYEDREKLLHMSRNGIDYIQKNYSPDNAIHVIGTEFDL